MDELGIFAVCNELGARVDSSMIGYDAVALRVAVALGIAYDIGLISLEGIALGYGS